MEEKQKQTITIHRKHTLKNKDTEELKIYMM